MTEQTELRVFYNLFELDRDYKEFCESSICSQAHPREMTARSHNWRIRWLHHEQCNSPYSRIGGMNFERIQCDIRVPWGLQRFMLTRLRSPRHKIEPLIAFYDKPWDMEYYK